MTNEYPMFDSRSPVYRYPVGAIAEGDNLHLKLLLPRSLGCSSAVLSIDTPSRHEYYGMFWCAMEGSSYEWWELDYSPGTAGLYWYTFTLQTVSGEKILRRDSMGKACLDTGEPWQLTVYERGFETPDWLCGGIMYQIFPDRFFSSGAHKENIPGDRILRNDWGGEPEWKPDMHGRVTNSDYFGGDLEGVTQKLDYLESLGVTCIYFNPVFEAHSNHRYNTADYTRIDPLLGNEADFRRLCIEAKKRGISIILDGVFSHTGDDSIYFNRMNRYPVSGAYNSASSPYFHWYSFQQWPDKYKSWWGFESLPEVDELSPDFNSFINGKCGIVQKWLALGARGWRLDVADELPDGFLDDLRTAVKEQDETALIIGEVWEDASNKQAYGQTRRYLLGKQLDSVMNYPFRNAILGFMSGHLCAEQSMNIILTILENYPPQVIHLLMNHIGTHDTERALTALAGEPSGNRGREWQSKQRLSDEQRAYGLIRLRSAALMQYTLPGVPCIYYGDEAGMEGYRDPFNRGCYPWGHEDGSLIDWYRKLGHMRKKLSCLAHGAFIPFIFLEHSLGYIRADKKQRLLVLFNSAAQELILPLPEEWSTGNVLIGAVPEKGHISLPPGGCSAILSCAEKNND